MKRNKLRYYYWAVIGSVALSILSFSYNAWRMEISESNNNRRTAAFELFKSLAEFEQNIYAAHYDKDTVTGNSRVAWVKVGLIRDLSELCGVSVQQRALSLNESWEKNWENIENDRTATDSIILHVDALRKALNDELESLK